MPRTLWNGAISFGLVHIPVSLYPASKDESIDFDWLDKRSMDPVGYKRINKRTGREIDKENIVKGVKVGSGDYVLLSDDEIRAAYPKTTKTIEIEAFVDAADIPFIYLDRPYYLGPQGNAAKVYTLLRETLIASGKVGIAKVVIQTKQHLAALMPVGPALMLHTLRWNNEVRGVDDLELPADKKSSLNAGELRMAKLLVDDMSQDWDPSAYSDSFRDAIMTLIDKKQKSGKVEAVEPLEEDVDHGSNVIDLTALLKRSLGKGGGAGGGKRAAANDDEGDAEDEDKPSRKAMKTAGGKASAKSAQSTGKSATKSTAKTASASSQKSTKAPAKKTSSRSAASGPTLASSGAKKTVKKTAATASPKKSAASSTRKRAA
ncbi:Ku protein [Pigmentiphaga aceris]|uniref:Non-homologous end joining protein Ku n=1 Tax=Pigmentiphaga aceris TaxID=1940612 RepID=A0A5C0B596_9BURK|nr:Ku protein [Pigmentiphaga aceris]QEI08833.1 Ku protein [Pigmentiphaga aceris]